MVDSDSEVEWVFVVDQLNAHKSVKLSLACSLTEYQFRHQRKHGILRNMERVSCSFGASHSILLIR